MRTRLPRNDAGAWLRASIVKRLPAQRMTRRQPVYPDRRAQAGIDRDAARLNTHALAEKRDPAAPERPEPPPPCGRVRCPRRDLLRCDGEAQPSARVRCRGRGDDESERRLRRGADSPVHALGASAWPELLVFAPGASSEATSNSFDGPRPFPAGCGWISAWCPRWRYPERLARVYDGHTKHRDWRISRKRGF